MAGLENNKWLQRVVFDAASVDRADVPADALNVLVDVLPVRSRWSYRSDMAAEFLADPAVLYSSAARLFAALPSVPVPVKETAAFLCRPDIPIVDAARIVASERRMSVLRQVAELPGRDSTVYEAVGSAFGKAMSKPSAPSGAGFGVLDNLLANPDVPLTVKAAAAAVPSADTWDECWDDGYAPEYSAACACWEQLKASALLQAAAFDGLTVSDSMLLDCASWQHLTTDQLRTVFAALRRLTADTDGSDPDHTDHSGSASPDRQVAALSEICDHAAADDEFLAEVDTWLDTDGFDPYVALPAPFFRFAYRRNRRLGRQVADPAEFWATHPDGLLEALTVAEWSFWTQIRSVTVLAEVLAEKPDGWRGAPRLGSWIVSPLTPLASSASADELLAGLDAAAATGMPDVLADVEELYWWSASYDALTFDVLKRLHQGVFMSPVASLRLLELLSATLGPDPEMWQIFDTISVPDATIGDILALAAQIADN